MRCRCRRWHLLDCHDGQRAGAGIFDISGPDYKDVPKLMPYIAVDDVDVRVKKATKAGAQVMKPAFDVPGVGGS